MMRTAIALCNLLFPRRTGCRMRLIAAWLLAFSTGDFSCLEREPQAPILPRPSKVRERRLAMAADRKVRDRKVREVAGQALKKKNVA